MQTPDNKQLTTFNSDSKNPENQELVSGLFLESELDPDLRLLIERWPDLPEHIKAAIKTLVEAHKGKEWRKEG